MPTLEQFIEDRPELQDLDSEEQLFEYNQYRLNYIDFLDALFD
jgi:hypothetical protein